MKFRAKRRARKKAVAFEQRELQNLKKDAFSKQSMDENRHLAECNL